MFGRRGRTHRRSEGQQADANATSTVTPDELPPLRAPDAGHDSGLAAIEAEFTISESDMALLDLGALEFAPTLSALDRQLADHATELDAFMMQLNDEWGAQLGTDVDLQPYLMIPERCWEGEHGETLLDVLGLAPTQTWNVLPLAGSPATASAVGVASHPGGESLHTYKPAIAFIDETLAKMRTACEQATFTSDSIDSDALERARDEAAGNIKTLARHIAGVVLGTEAVNETRATFFND